MKNNFEINGDIVHIQIECKGETYITDIDLDCLKIMQLYDATWTGIRKPNGTIYVGTTYRGKKLKLHRVVSGALLDKVVEHRDGNCLNNRRDNLRQTNKNYNKKWKAQHLILRIPIKLEV